MKITAFHRYIASLPMDEAVKHIHDCLINGPPDNLAWNFMDEMNPDGWTVNPPELMNKIAQAVILFEDRLINEKL